MSTLLTINVTNNSAVTQDFFFFQEPATYVGGPQVYSNSLFSSPLGVYSQTGSILTFQVDLQYYAGVQQTNSPPAVGSSSGFSSASRPIDLTTTTGEPNNSTKMSVNPLGLSPATYTPGVELGAFRITTPPWDPPALYNAGSAVSVMGGIVLSSFVQAQPSQNIDCQPILIYYVQTGNYTPGTVMNFDASSVDSAVCDFTSGQTVANVSINPDGTWTVSWPPQAQAKRAR